MDLMPVAEALERILSGVMPLGMETVGLRFASERTLANALSANLTHPPFNASSMDGYAVKYDDLKSIPASLTVIGEAAAGRPFTGIVQSGEVVRIFTGAPVPDSTDTVVIQENVRVNGKTISIDQVPPRGEHVRRKGQDFNTGDHLLDAGKCLNARDLLLAATAGHGTISVVRRPVVAILATGDELVEPGEEPDEGQIIGSNSYGLVALVERAGGFPKLLGIAGDSAEDLADKFKQAEAADIIVTTGGASVGDHDLVRPALEKAGAKLHFYKIAMRPGKPMFFGTRQGSNGLQRIIGLPGNPVSAMICARVFLAPLILKLHATTWGITPFEAILTEPIAANGPRDHYMRASLDDSVMPPRVTPLTNQDSALVSAFAKADCLVVVPANTPAQNSGEHVTVMALDF